MNWIENLFCAEKECTDMTFLNGSIKCDGNAYIRDECTIECNANYELSGSSKIQCGSDKSFNKGSQTCTSKFEKIIVLWYSFI